MFGSSAGEFLAGILDRLRTQIPEAVYNHATQADLVNSALSAVIRQAVRGFAEDLLAKGPMGGAVGSIFGQVAGALGVAQQLGAGALLQQALDSTDLDEQLRDALTEGFARYLKENAGRLAQVALSALSEVARERG